MLRFATVTVITPLKWEPLESAWIMGNLYRNSPETFTQPPTGKRGENKKTGPPAWKNQGEAPL